MTSLNHDDAIEIISSQAEVTPVTDPGFVSFSTGEGGGEANRDDRARVFPMPIREKLPSPKQKRIKGAVMVVGTLLILASLILVAVTLSMSDHIDEMVRKMNGMGTTPRPARPPPVKSNHTLG